MSDLAIKDYEDVLADKRRLTRELDVAMHGEAGAAKQASLCDLIEPARRLRERAELAESRLEDARKALEAARDHIAAANPLANILLTLDPLISGTQAQSNEIREPEGSLEGGR